MERFRGRARVGVAIAGSIVGACTTASSSTGWTGPELPADEVLSTSPPAAQGMDGGRLDQGLRPLDGATSLYSLLIVRHDAVVFERYYNGSGPTHAVPSASITKTVVSALTGIALRDGTLEGVDQTLGELFPAETAPRRSRAKGEITVEHVLTMSAGLVPLRVARADVVKEALDLPLVTAPGAVFRYNSALPHLLSTAIARVRREDTARYARRTLFDPLGIEVEAWERDPQGVALGAAGLDLTARDLAKLGLLYLHGGEWNGVPILPEGWVEASWTPRVPVERSSEVDSEASWWLAPAVAGHDDHFDYGYYWWINTLEGHAVFTAIGWGGQKLHVVPDLDLVVVTTADPERAGEAIDSFGLLERVVLPAVDGGPPVGKPVSPLP